MNREKILSIKEAAEQLGVKINTLYCWVYLRKIEHVKIGRLVKFRQSVIDKFIEDHSIAIKN